MPLVLVDRDALAMLLEGDYSNRQETVIEGGCASQWYAEWQFLEADDALVTLAVQAGLPIPGPMRPGALPPLPPSHPFDVNRMLQLVTECKERVRAAHEQGYRYGERDMASRARNRPGDGDMGG